MNDNEQAQDGSDFAPAARSTAEEIERHVRYFLENPVSLRMLDAVPDAILILNKNRQVVFANQAVAGLMKVRQREQFYGKRPGELLSCVHMDEKLSGCGTTEACSTCGALRAILKSLDGAVAVEQCRILKHPGSSALDLRVSGTPFRVYGDQHFCIHRHQPPEAAGSAGTHLLSRHFEHCRRASRPLRHPAGCHAGGN